MKWAIREAVDVYFKAKTLTRLGARTIRKGEPMLIFDTVKTSTMEVASQMSYVTGGRGNARLLSYEGDKTLTFKFDDALISAEGIAILSGADLIPARNKDLPGASPEAKSVVTHVTEQYPVTTQNAIDSDAYNVYADDASLYPPNDAHDGYDYSPRGGLENVWLYQKPYVGQNSSIYVMLLDEAGEVSGIPIEINLDNLSKKGPDSSPSVTINGKAFNDDLKDQSIAGDREYSTAQSYYCKFTQGEYFIAFDKDNLPMLTKEYSAYRKDATVYPDPVIFDGEKYKYQYLSTIDGTKDFDKNKGKASNAVFDDMVKYYVDLKSVKENWVDSWGDIDQAEDYYIRQIGKGAIGDSGNSQAESATFEDRYSYTYLLRPSGGYAQPKAYKEGTSFVYKLNVPSILYQDIVTIDFYTEYRHDATQISILPDKFGPYVYVEGESLIRRASDGVDLPVKFVIPKLKITTSLNFTMQSSGDASVFSFSGDAYSDFSKFDLTRKVLADIQILDADDNYDLTQEATGDPTSYRRFKYNDDTDGEYIWKDPSIEEHSNLDFSDTGDYVPTHGGPATLTKGDGLIDTAVRRKLDDNEDEDGAKERDPGKKLDANNALENWIPNIDHLRWPIDREHRVSQASSGDTGSGDTGGDTTPPSDSTNETGGS